MVFLRLENGNSSCRQAGFLIIADQELKEEERSKKRHSKIKGNSNGKTNRTNRDLLSRLWNKTLSCWRFS